MYSLILHEETVFYDLEMSLVGIFTAMVTCFNIWGGICLKVGNILFFKGNCQNVYGIGKDTKC